MSFIDVNDVGSWPPALRDHVENSARELDGTAEYAGDLRISIENEDAFRDLFGGRHLRVYHATRLFDYECDAIQSHGLRRLTRDLVDQRIEAAAQRRLISRELRKKLRENHVFALNRAEHRASQVCFFVPENSLVEDPSGVWRLLSFWGGEAIYWASADEPATAAILGALGRPAIVVANIDLSEGWSRHHTFPSLEKLFVGSLLGLERCWSDVFYRSDVPAGQVIDVWRPGDDEYDRFQELPR